MGKQCLLFANCSKVENSNTKQTGFLIPFADIYTILLGTNDWNAENQLGTQGDFQKRTRGTILGNFAILLDHIRQANPKARIVVGNPVERADFVYTVNQWHPPNKYQKPQYNITLHIYSEFVLFYSEYILYLEENRYGFYW